MAELPAVNELSTASDQGELKASLEDFRDTTAQILGVSAETTLTIASGVVTPPSAGPGIHSIDTEVATANDDLSNIVVTNRPNGTLLLIRPANAARTITMKHNAGGSGQITLRNGGDVTLGDTNHWLLLKLTGTTWVEVLRSPVEGVSGVLTKTGAYTVTQADRNKLIDASSRPWTLTLLAGAAAGIGFKLPVRNSGAGLITIDPNSSETINGVATLVLYPGDTAVLECDGTNWKTESRFAQSKPISAKTGAYTIAAIDNDTLIDVTSGTFTLGVTAAATLGSGFHVMIRNSGSGTVTVDPNASETVDGSTTYALGPGAAIELICDGSNFKSLSKGGSAVAGSLTAGTQCIINPYATSTKGATGHGLGGHPDFVDVYVECLTAELGYAIGDRIRASQLWNNAASSGWLTVTTAANIVVLTSANALIVLNGTTPTTGVTLTSANWKLVATPYRRNP